jgi:hypothetical protein
MDRNILDPRFDNASLTIALALAALWSIAVIVCSLGNYGGL